MSDSFSIIVTSDSQYPWYDHVLPAGLEVQEVSNAWRDDALKTNSRRQIAARYKSINQLIQTPLTPGYAVKGVIINGDVTEHGHEWQYSEMRDQLAGLKAPVYFSLGNHDYTQNFDTDGYHAPSRMVDWMSRQFGPTSRTKVEAFDFKIIPQPVIRDDFSGSLAYSFIINNVRFINLQHYPSYTKTWNCTTVLPIGNISSYGNYTITSSFDWFATQLEKAKTNGNMIVVFLHNYDDDFFYWAGSGQDVQKFNKLVADYDVSAVFAGHIHDFFGYKGMVPGSYIPHFRSGAAGFQTYLVVDLDPSLRRLKVWAMASVVDGPYLPTGHSWECSSGNKPVMKQVPGPWNTVMPNSPLTGAPISDLSRCVYYVDRQQHIHELNVQETAMTAPDTDLTKTAKVDVNLTAGTPLASFGEGSHAYLFHIGTDKISRDQYVYAFSNDPARGGWNRDDLTTLTSAARAVNTSGLTCHGPSNSARVFYVGNDKPDNHIHCLYFAGGSGWKYADLTKNLTNLAECPNVPPLRGSGLTCFGSASTAYVFYIGTDHHVHVYWYDLTQGWKHADLMKQKASSSAPPVAGNSLTCYGPPQDAHVFYIGTDGNVHCLWWDSNQGWSHRGLFNPADSADVSPISGSPLACFGAGSSVCVFYIGRNKFLDNGTYKFENHVHAYWYDPGQGWKHADLGWLNAETGQPGKPAPVSADSPLISFSVNGKVRVYYIGDVDYVEIQELWLNGGGKWYRNSLTGAPPGWKPTAVV